MHIDPFDPSTPYISKFLKSKMAAAANLKNPTKPEVVLAAKQYTFIYSIKME